MFRSVIDTCAQRYRIVEFYSICLCILSSIQTLFHKIEPWITERKRKLKYRQKNYRPVNRQQKNNLSCTVFSTSCQVYIFRGFRDEVCVLLVQFVLIVIAVVHTERTFDLSFNFTVKCTFCTNVYRDDARSCEALN